MNYKILIVLLTLYLVTSVADSSPIIVASVVSNASAACHGQTLAPLRDEIKRILQSSYSNSNNEDTWREIVNFDMTNPSHSCPSPWTMVTSPSKLCVASSCSDSVTFNVPTSYSYILGQVIGYATISPDAFFRHLGFNPTIEMNYLDGVSITHGHPRQHIWSLAAGHGGEYNRCPCDSDNHSIAPFPPSFVGEKYFCDGPHNGLLWDGQGCTTACCTFHSPPWFNVSLPTPTSDSIEVRVCTDQELSDERIYVKKMILLVY